MTTITAIHDVSLEISDGEIVTLLGPSGCGKTTVLRCIAGLEEPNSGEIRIDGKLVYSGPSGLNVPPNDRALGMVFQSYALWPHMTVFENIAYPLRTSKPSLKHNEASKRVTRMLEQLRIQELATRNISTLSGGQQQRVALGRALIRQPKLLLLDEPLSNLDTQLREEMRLELKELFASSGAAVLYVTHDLTEGLMLGDRMIVMESGAIAQDDTPQKLFSAPCNQFVADFVGANNLLAGTVTKVTKSQVTVYLESGIITCPLADNHFSEGENIIVAIRPEHLTLGSPPKTSKGITTPCRIEQSGFLGSAIEYLIKVSSLQMTARVPASASIFGTGETTTVHIPENYCIPMPLLSD